MMSLKYHFFGSECVVTHGHKIRKKAGNFRILQDEAIHAEFMDAVCHCFGSLDGCLVIAAVDKPRVRTH
jgi:hypothetical protein